MATEGTSASTLAHTHRATMSAVVRYQLELICDKLPAHVQAWLETASMVHLVEAATQIAMRGYSRSWEDYLPFLAQECQRSQFRVALQQRFGELSAEIETGIRWLESWQLEEYGSEICTAESAEAAVFRSITLQLKLIGYREGLAIAKAELAEAQR